MKTKFISKSVVLFVATMLMGSTIGVKAQFSAKEKVVEYEFAISPKTSIVYEQIDVIPLSFAARYCFNNNASLGLQTSPTFYTYMEQTSETSLTYRNDVFLPLMLTFRYTMLPYEKISLYVNLNAGAGIYFADNGGEAFGLHGGLYLGADLLQRENFDLFVELGVEYSVLGPLTPLRVGFRL